MSIILLIFVNWKVKNEEGALSVVELVNTCVFEEETIKVRFKMLLIKYLKFLLTIWVFIFKFQPPKFLLTIIKLLLLLLLNYYYFIKLSFIEFVLYFQHLPKGRWKARL